MHHLSPMLRREDPVKGRSSGCQDQVRFFALLRIKPHAPPLVRVPVNSFEFHSCERTPQVEYLLRLLRHRRVITPRHLVFIFVFILYFFEKKVQRLSPPSCSHIILDTRVGEKVSHKNQKIKNKVATLFFIFMKVTIDYQLIIIN